MPKQPEDQHFASEAFYEELGQLEDSEISIGDAEAECRRINRKRDPRDPRSPGITKQDVARLKALRAYIAILVAQEQIKGTPAEEQNHSVFEREYKPRNCRWCQTTFTPTNPNKRYCSTSCGDTAKRKQQARHLKSKKQDPVLIKCELCEKKFKKLASSRQKLCSQKCRIMKRRSIKICRHCKSKYRGKVTQQFCSQECSGKFNGENRPWKVKPIREVGIYKPTTSEIRNMAPRPAVKPELQRV